MEGSQRSLEGTRSPLVTGKAPKLFWGARVSLTTGGGGGECHLGGEGTASRGVLCDAGGRVGVKIVRHLLGSILEGTVPNLLQKGVLIVTCG